MRFFAFIAIAGCAHVPPPLPPRLCILPEMVAVASTVPELMADVIEAESYWNMELGRQVFIDVGLTDRHVGGIAMIEHGETGAHFTATKLVVGDADGCEHGSMTTVGDAALSRPSEERQTMLRHELGHVLGLEHSDNLGDLMSGREDRDAQHPINASPGEVARLRAMYGKAP